LGIFVREHAKAVRDAGHRVVVLHLPGPRRELDGLFWKMDEELDPSLLEGIEAHHVVSRRLAVRGSSYALYLSSALAAYRRLRVGGFRPDVIHGHTYGAGVPAALAAGRTGVPLVITEQFTGFPRRTLRRPEVLKARYAYNRAARALPVSKDLREAMRSYGIDARFEVVPNVVDTSLFFPGEDSKNEKGEHRLIFVGNLEPLQHKGFPTLLQALVRLHERRQDWHLDVIGDGPERTAYEDSAAALGLREKVHFHGPQSKPVIAQMMRAADLFVLPSRFDNLPCVVVEALASGLPVVSTTVGGIPELVDERSGKLVAPDDPGALAEALDGTLDELAKYDRRAIAATARNRYSLEVVGDHLSRIYDSVLAEARAQAVRLPARRRRTQVRDEKSG
jgi:glycosyltransferase involved in cell wall biosynthesis